MNALTNVMARSQSDFESIVWPVIRHSCGGGILIPVESVSEASFAKNLDMLAGIDAWQQFSDDDAGQVMRGLATRVQWTDDPYNSFTVRRSVTSGAKTEYDKRVAAMNGRGFLYPHLTVQAYLHNGQLLSVGVAKTSDVINACSENQVRTNKKDGNTFYYINFKQLPECKAGVWNIK